MKSKKLLAIIIVLIFMASYAGLIAFRAYERALNRKVSAQEEVPIPVEAFRVSHMAMKSMAMITGTVNAYEEVKISPRVSGTKVTKIYKEEGDLVREGEVLADLDTDMIDAQIAQAKAGRASAMAAIKQAEAQVSTIGKDYERIKKLYEEEVVPKQKLDQIEGQYLAAKASLEMAKRKLEEAEALIRQLELSRSYHRVTAPVSGIVSQRNVDVGEMVSPSTIMFKISNISEVKVRGSVPETYLPLMKPGIRATVLVDTYPDREFSGSVRIVSPSIDPKTRTAEIEIRIENKGLLLRPGMFARARIDLGERMVLFVPQQALRKFEGTGTYYVYVVDENKRARIREVTIGDRSGERIEIVKGLKEGELVVLTVTSAVKDGSLLGVKEVKLD